MFMTFTLYFTYGKYLVHHWSSIPIHPHWYSPNSLSELGIYYFLDFSCQQFKYYTQQSYSSVLIAFQFFGMCSCIHVSLVSFFMHLISCYLPYLSNSSLTISYPVLLRFFIIITISLISISGGSLSSVPSSCYY